MPMQEAVNELSRLYRLKAEGKKVDTLIAEFEGKLFELCEDKVDAEKAYEKNNKVW